MHKMTVTILHRLGKAWYIVAILTSLLVFPPSEAFGQCAIEELYAEVHPCNDEGQIYIDFEFSAKGGLSDWFVVRGNGVIYDTLPYGETFYTIGPIEPDCELVYELVVHDVNNPECNDAIGFEEQLCCNTCEFQNVAFTNIDCQENTISLTLDFDVINPTNDFFDLYVGETFLGFFAHEALPIALQIPQNEVGSSIFTIQDNDNPDCILEITFNHPLCEGEVCNFSEAVYEVSECADFDSIFLHIAFDYNQNQGNDFVLFVEGEQFGPFTYGNQYYEIGPFSQQCDESLTLVIYDEEAECEAILIDEVVICCPQNPECDITEFEYFDVECIQGDEPSFHVSVNFAYEGFTNPFVDVFINDQFYDFLALEELPFRLLNLDATSDITVITLCQNDSDCCHEFIIENPDCGSNEECNISEIEYFDVECIQGDEPSFHVSVNFAYEGFTNPFVDVFINDQFYDFLALEELPFRLLNLDATSDITVITLCQNDSDCCHEFIIENPNCGSNEECNISEIFTEIHPCDANGNFFVDIIFDVTNPESNQFIIVGNGVEYGTFEYGQDFYTIGPLSGDCQTLYEFIIIDNESESCAGETGFEEPICCDSSCQIFDVFAEVSACEGEVFDVSVGFEYLGEVSGSFSIIGNGNNYGTFDYGLPFYTLTGLIADCETIYEFAVIDFENEECSDFVVLQEPVCCDDNPECAISDFEIFEVFCENAIISFLLNFDVNQPTNEYFDLWVNEEFYGFYPLEDLPIEITLENNTTEIVHLLACINDNETCCGEAEFEVPECDNEADCNITWLEYEHSDCDEAGMFTIDFLFGIDNPASGGFHVLSDGVILTTFEYGADFYTIGPFEGDCETLYVFTIVDQEDEGCMAVLEYDEPICCTDCPSEFDIYVEENAAGELILYIESESVEGVFLLYINDNLVGEFPYGGIQSLDLESGTSYSIVVQDVENEDCFEIFEIETEGPSSTQPAFINSETVYHDGSKLYYLVHQTARITIFDMSGKLVHQFSEFSGPSSIELAILSGIYLVEIQLPTERALLKIAVR